MKNIYLFIILLFYGSQAICLSPPDFKHPALWPNTDFNWKPRNLAEQEAKDALFKRANTFLQESPRAITILASAGKTDEDDAALVASRQAIQDADRAAVLALAFRLSQDSRYLNKTSEILLDWARVNQPTGHPIDETRLEGMIVAYDLISPFLSSDNRTEIIAWFETLRTKKIAWKFGPKTLVNNHYTHQLKMLLLLDKILHKEDAWKMEVDNAKKFAGINLNMETGASIDYEQRDALYYHNFDLQPWLEISWVTGCCKREVSKAFYFLAKRIRSHQLGGEFNHSTTPLDKLRAENGFAYAEKGGVFDLNKAAPTVISYYTLTAEKPPEDLWALTQTAKPSPWLAFLRMRLILTKPHSL